jgi:hypothetical protein
MQGLEVKMLWGEALSAWTYILPHGVAGQLACHSPVTCWRCENTFVRLLRRVVCSSRAYRSVERSLLNTYN